jgi:outer membrane protein, multidrug efflux system
MRRFTSALCLALAGCALGHIEPVAVPPVKSPAAWRSSPSTAGWVAPDWWRCFGDPRLDALVERALANNPDIAIAMGRVREAQGDLRTVTANLHPTLDLATTAGHSRAVSAFGTPLVQDALEPQALAGYELDLFGRLADQRAAARDGYLASKYANDAVRLSVASAVATTYITLVGLDARLDVASSTLKERSESLRIARARASAGYAPQLDLDQAEAEYQAARQIVPQVEIAIAQAENGLNLLTGDTPSSVARAKGLHELAVVAVPAGMPSTLLDRRPDIAAASLELASSDKTLSATRKQFLPRLDLTATAGAAFSSILANPITVWSIGGSVLAPLFEGGRLTGAAEAAAGRRDQAAFAYRKTVLGAFQEVEDSLAAVARLDEQVTATEAQRDALQSALRHATNRYREGYSPYLEQLEAERQLLAAELALVQARTDALNARVRLFAALGGGWSTSGRPTG